MKKFYLAVLCLSCFAAQAQFSNIQISPTGCTEASIAIDPNDPSRMVAATNCTYSYYSADSGKTWAPCINDSIAPGKWCYDPCMVADYNGNFYYFHNYEMQPLPRKTMQKSFNGGKNWSFAGNVPGLYDKEMVCVRPSTGELYAVYIPLTGGLTNVGYSRSADGGLTWTAMSYVNTGTYSGIQWGAAPAPGVANGELYVIWQNNIGLFFQKTTDNGVTWMAQDKNLSYWINNTNGYNCMPSIATDLSNGPNKGNIYITWWEKDAAGTDTDIYFAKSTDKGATFTVTNIASDILTDQQLPQITVDQSTGNIYVVYYSQVGSTNTYDVKMAFSLNGGSSFYNALVSTQPAIWATGYHHYIGNAAAGGVIRPAWTRNLEFYTALISEQALLLTTTGDLKKESAINVFPNPSNGLFHVNAALNGELSVMNTLGQVVHTGMMEGMQLSIDISHLPRGMYLVTLKTEKGTVTEKLLKN